MSMEELARKHKIEFKPIGVSHVDLAASMEKEGICAALTMIFLSRQLKMAAPDDVFKHETFSQVVAKIKSDPTMAYFVKQFQQSETSRHQMHLFARLADQNANSVSKVIEVLQAGMRAMKVNAQIYSTRGPNNVSCQDRFPFKAIAKQIVDVQGRHYVMFTRHVVGAFTHYRNNKYKFFDANHGQAIATAKTDFYEFLADYFQSDAVNGTFLFQKGYVNEGAYAYVISFI